MKKLFIFVLCLFLVAVSAQAGAGGNSAKQDEPLRQAGKSSIYFYDVKATQYHGSGKLVIDTDKQTFVFIGQDFTPDERVYVEARTDTGLELVAMGRSTPSGNVHMSGQWEKSLPAEVLCVTGVQIDYGNRDAWGFSLLNRGAFIAKMAIYWYTEINEDGYPVWHETSITSENLTASERSEIPLGYFGVPYGATVRIHAIVVSGADRTGSEWFTYYGRDINPGYCWPHYEISGTLFNPILLQDLDAYVCTDF